YYHTCNFRLLFGYLNSLPRMQHPLIKASSRDTVIRASSCHGFVRSTKSVQCIRLTLSDLRIQVGPLTVTARPFRVPVVHRFSGTRTRIVRLKPGRTPRLERRTPRCEQSTKGARVAPSHPDPTESPTVLSDSPADELPATVQHMPGSSRSRRSERRPSRIPESAALPQQSPDPIRAGHQQRSPHRLLRQPWPG